VILLIKLEDTFAIEFEYKLRTNIMIVKNKFTLNFRIFCYLSKESQSLSSKVSVLTLRFFIFLSRS